MKLANAFRTLLATLQPRTLFKLLLINGVRITASLQHVVRIAHATDAGNVVGQRYEPKPTILSNCLHYDRSATIVTLVMASIFLVALYGRLPVIRILFANSQLVGNQ